MEMFAFTSYPSFHRFLLEGNIVEEIPFIFRLFFSFNGVLLMLLSFPPREEYGSFLKLIEVRMRSFLWPEKYR